MVLNAAYAYLAARADAADQVELALKPHVNDETAKQLCGNRKELDDWLATPFGEAASDEQAVLKFLTT